jgi:hypothetical protein
MSNLSLGSTYSNARASLVTATGKTRSGGGYGGATGGSGVGIGDVELTLPNIPVDVDWTLDSNQGPTLAVKNKPDPDFYKQPNNPFSTLQGVPPNGGATIDYVQVGAMDARTYVSAPTFSATQSIQTSNASNIQDFSGNPLFAPVAGTGNYADLSNQPPQLGNVELQLQTVPTSVDWNLTTNQGSALAIINKPTQWPQWQWIFDITPMDLGGVYADGSERSPHYRIPAAAFWKFQPFSTGANIMGSDGTITIPSSGLYTIDFKVQMQGPNVQTLNVVIQLQTSDGTNASVFFNGPAVMFYTNTYASGLGVVWSESRTTPLTAGTVLTPAFQYTENTPLGTISSPAYVVQYTTINIVKVA